MKQSVRATRAAARAEDPRERGMMLVRLVGIQLAAAAVFLGVPPLIPALRDEFSLSRGGAGLLMTAASLGVVAGSLPAGRMVNAVGVRRSMLAATLGLGGTLALTGVASSYALLMPVLFLIGLFYSPVTPATNAGVVAWARPGFRTRGMAIKQMGVTAGAAISAALIPALTAKFGWRAAAAIVGILLGCAGAVAANGFARPSAVRSASRSSSLVNRPAVVAVGVGAFLMLFVQHAVATHYILALQDEGLALVGAGAALSLLQVSATGARFGWAWFADRALGGNAPLAVLILCLFSTAVLILMTLLDGTSAPVVGAVFLGGTTQAGNGLMQVVVSDSGGAAPARSTGVGMAIGFTGTMLGPPAFGFLADAWSYRSSWFVLGAVALCCGVLTWRVGRSLAQVPS